MYAGYILSVAFGLYGWCDMLLKTCGRCGRLIPYGRGYCSDCTPVVEAEREARRLEAQRRSNKRYNAKRDPKYVRFYNGADWRALSAKRLADSGYRCDCCGAVASDVDHIVPIQTPEGWERRFDYNNLQSLCISCHNKKHKRFTRRR